MTQLYVNSLFIDRHSVFEILNPSKLFEFENVPWDTPCTTDAQAFSSTHGGFLSR